MAKQGMRRPGSGVPKEPHNDAVDVQEIQGKAKTGNEKAGPVNAPNWAREDYKTGDRYQ